MEAFRAVDADGVPACRHVTALDGFGRLATCAVQARLDVESTWTGGRHGLDRRLVVIGDDFAEDHPGTLDGLAKERLCARRVALVAKEHIHDYAIFVDRSIEVPLLILAEQEHLIYEPPLADGTSLATHLGSQSRSEGVDPIEDGAVRDMMLSVRSLSFNPA
jgi:hypothetical protein